MRSFDNLRAGVLTVVLAAASGPAVPVHAQSAAALRYEATRELEQLVSESPAATADDFRFVINRYWSLVRRFPTNGYADNALWQAGNLSIEAFRRF